MPPSPNTSSSPGSGGGGYGPLPPALLASLKATASLSITELTAEGMASANDPKLYPWVQISEILDARTCPLCAAVNGKVMSVDDPAYAKWRQPSHIGCRRLMSYISADSGGTIVTFKEPDAALIEKHGHYHLKPEKYAELKVPSEPGGRQFIARRVKNADTGEVKTVLEWAPWWEQIPAYKRDLVLKARAATDDTVLKGLIEQLGLNAIEDVNERLRQTVLLGLRDRLEGWITEQIKAYVQGEGNA